MTISVVQTAYSSSFTGTVSFASPVTAGNTVFAVLYCYGNSPITVTGVTLGGSTVTGTTQIQVESGSGLNIVVESIWMLPDVPGGATAVAGAETGGSGFAGIAVFEVAGLGPAPVVDQVAGNASTGNINIVTGTTTAPAEFILGAGIGYGFSPGNPGSPWQGWTDASGNGYSYSAYQIASSEGTFTWASTPGDGSGNWSAGIVTVAASVPSSLPVRSQAVYARRPLGAPRRGVYRGVSPKDTSFGTGQVQWNAGGPVKNPTAGPVFRQATSPIRARIPQNRARGVFMGVAPGDTSYGTGQIQWNAGAPVKNPASGPAFRQRTTPVRFILPPPHPRAGRVGSSFGAPVENPVHGPPAYALEGPVRARLPRTSVSGSITAEFAAGTGSISGPLNGTGSGNGVGCNGAPVRNPAPRPVFRQAASPARARIPQNRARGVYTGMAPGDTSFGTGQIQWNAGAQVQNPGGVFQRGTPVIATGTTSVTGTWPTGSTQAKGDLLVAVVGVYGSGGAAAAATPAGWTCIENNYSGPTSITIFTKVAAGGDAAPTFSATATGSANIACVLYDLAHPSGYTPQVTVSGDAFGTSGPIAVTTGGNVPSPGCFAISGAICSQGTTSAATTWTTPGSWSPGGDQAASNVSQLASYYYSGPPGGSQLSCVFTHSRTSTEQAAALIVAQPPAAGALSVTATMAGNTYEGLGLYVAVLTGAAGNPAGTTGTATGTTGNVSITPVATGSGIVGAVVDANGDAALTAEASSQWVLAAQDTYNTADYYAFFPLTLTSSGTPVVVGTSTALAGGNIAAVEVKAAGTLAVWGVESTWTANATAAQTYWFTPPPGSLIVALLPSEGNTGTVTATVSDTLGLTWTQAVFSNATSGGGYAGVWLAQVPATPAWLPSPVRARLPQPPLGTGAFRGRVGSSKGAVVANPASGPVFRQATSPVRARFPREASSGSITGTGTGGAICGAINGNGFGNGSGSKGAPVKNPASGPVFRPAVTPARIRPALPPRGRIASDAGAPVVFQVTGPPFYPIRFPARARIPQNGPRGRIESNPGAQVRNPVPGPVFRQAAHPARAVIPQVFSKGRTGSNPGHVTPPSPPPLYPLAGPVRTRTAPPFSRGRTRSSAGAPVRNPASGPVFRQAVKPARAVIPQNAPRGRTGSSPGGPVQNPPPPVTGAPFLGRGPVRARYLNQVYVLGDPGLIYVDSRDGSP